MKIITQEVISYQSAVELVSEAIKVAEAMNIQVSACVVDINGRVKAKVTMDGAPIIADELVEKKAKTALLGMSSQDFGAVVKDIPEVKSSMLTLDQITLLGGGIPLIAHEKIVGAFAVGGGTTDQDVECATKALEIF